jgi:hemoglobin-like flavoprotein
MSEDAVTVARNSLSRCARSGKFFDRFYELLLASSQEIRDKFAGTDFERQKRVVADSLFLMMAAAGARKGPAYEHLEQLGGRHSRDQLDIRPEWYELWMNSLLDAASEHDPDFTEETRAAWRQALQPGIDLLISKY